MEEIDEMFLNVSIKYLLCDLDRGHTNGVYQRVPTRKFKSYICTGNVGDYSITQHETKNVLEKGHAVVSEVDHA